MLWLDQFRTPADLLLPVSSHTCFLLCLAHVQIHVANILLSSVRRQLLYSVSQDIADMRECISDQLAVCL